MAGEGRPRAAERVSLSAGTHMRGKRILLGVTGGIAAYKSAYLVRELVRAGADVRVVMTEAATEFIAPLTFSALTKQPVGTDLWSRDQTTGSEIGTRHIHLATWCDCMLIAPASANTLAKLAHGLSDNLVTVLALACRKPVIVAPTMDADMFLNEATQHNIAVLRERGFGVIPPAEGEHASGLYGPGRLPEVEVIMAFLKKLFDRTAEDLRKVKMLVTAGPTHEPIDPVRYISNRSSGKMGFALALAAAQRGAEVTLVTGPVSLETPRNVKRIDVETAEHMRAAVVKVARQQRVIAMAAAVADYAPALPADRKIKKDGQNGGLELTLKSTPDILGELGRKKRKGTLLVGFALETNDGVSNAKEKLSKKNLDVIVLNAYTAQNPVFGSDRNTVTIIDRKGEEELPSLEKIEVANRILNRIRKLL